MDPAISRDAGAFREIRALITEEAGGFKALSRVEKHEFPDPFPDFFRAINKALLRAPVLT